MKKGQSFEQAMNRLEEISQSLESGDIPLEESIKLYEEGIKLVEFCQSKLTEAEKKVKKLIRTGEGKFETTPLDEPDTTEAE
jgi:exodeoxyribonuclease VII small subunit